MARSTRAVAILREHIPVGERILDLGCGIGITTAKASRYYDVYATDTSRERLWRARKIAPKAHFTLSDGGLRLAYPDAHFAAVLMLDVLEHVNDEQAIRAEVGRVLRPGGLLVLSVPNTGLLRWADSLNLYAWLTHEDPHGAPGRSVAEFMFHRHYSLRSLHGILGGGFRIEYSHFSGLGVAEFVHLGVLLLCKRFLRSRRRYGEMVSAYYTTYLWEDEWQLNGLGYHLMIAARRVSAA